MNVFRLKVSRLAVRFYKEKKAHTHCWISFSQANNVLVALSDLQAPLEALSQQQAQQAARLGQWGEAAGPFLQGGLGFPLPQQLAHLAQPGLGRFHPQLLRPASWGLGAASATAAMEEEGGVPCPAPTAGPPYTR